MGRCALASRSRITAFREGRYVLVVAVGELPTPGFDVDLTPSPLRIFPQQFNLERCARSGIFPQHVTPYRHAEVVLFPEDQPRITVHHADGTDQVDIEPCGKDLAGFVDAVRGDSPRPAAADGVTSVPGQPAADEAVGLSATLSFDDAFAHALANLPTSDVKGADALDHVRVEEIGGLFGGIAGFHHLFVRVSRTTA